MLNIFYCHGFASSFDPSKSKVQTLCKLGPVSGCDIDYTKEANKVVAKVIEHGDFANIDLIVGTSIGGWLAEYLGVWLGIPFVAINPPVNPQQILHKYIGSGMDFQGQPYTLNESTVASYYPVARKDCGLILLDEGDEVIDARITQEVFKDFYSVKSFRGGNHRFAHMEEALPLIEALHSRARLVDGLGGN